MNRFGIFNSLQRLCIVVWVGGGLFFACVLAPSAFRVLADRRAAGLLVGASLRALHWIGLACGTLLLSTMALSPVTPSRVRSWGLVLVALMLALTGYSQFVILPAMEEIRAAGTTSHAFRALHGRSVWVEGAVLLLGLTLAILPEAGSLEASRRR